MTYKYENGFTGREMKMLKAMPHCTAKNFVQVGEDEYYIYSTFVCDNDKPCYKRVVSYKTGVELNVNMNNGVAYRVAY